MTTAQAVGVTAQEFGSMFESLKNWGRWGEKDQLGALNLITPQKRIDAARLVTDGTAVSLSNAIPVRPGPNNPRPAVRAVLNAGDVARDGFGAAGDMTIVAPHGLATSHIDALCHVFWNKQMYNGHSATRMNSAGAGVLAIDALRHGVVSRGVLLDIPRLNGRDFLAAGDAIGIEDLEAAEQRQGVRVEEGDILLIRTGRHLREATTGETVLNDAAAGLHVTTMPWIKDRGVAMLGSDSFTDVVPSGVDNVMLPVHVITLVALGVHLLDHLALEDVAKACAEKNRWEFQLMVAPLVIERGTGSVVNPIAVF